MPHDVDKRRHCKRDNHAEIEITDNMIDAGKVALAGYSPYFDLEEDAVASIYRAMVIAKRSGIGCGDPIADFLELYDAAHAVIDMIRLHVDHAEYEGGMNAVERFRDVSADMRWKHADKVPDPLELDDDDDYPGEDIDGPN